MKIIKIILFTIFFSFTNNYGMTINSEQAEFFTEEEVKRLEETLSMIHPDLIGISISEETIEEIEQRQKIEDQKQKINRIKQIISEL